jgi:hypothetical protein
MSDEASKFGINRFGISASTRDAARRRGQSHFANPAAHQTAFKAEVTREREASDAKTAKLRALRLAKEEDDRVAAANAPPPPPKKTRAKAAKPGT